ncbi:MAG: HyaD/HybD family hydrogenase maturation endopeptidase [Desulfovibrionales bacterium]|nr:MAG: HyaD/HybD family hydrogenase maturation endopeptidase [Desulfovibrionales bacterium]
MNENNKPQILVLGVGNILLKDEGVGVKAVEKLRAEYAFSPNVELMDGGTLGMALMDPIMEFDRLIVVDAVVNGGEPGTLYRLVGVEMGKSVAFKNSMHQTDLLETLATCKVLGNCPETVVIGMEPKEFDPWGTELTPPCQARLDELCRFVLQEVSEQGGEYHPASEKTVRDSNTEKSC